METKKPICGSLSVVMPVVGFLLSFASITLSHEPADTHGVSRLGLVILTLSFLCPISGVVFSIMGMVRHESLRWLPIFGFVWSICCAASYFAT
ncbi:MAG: hypothetical protein JWN25_3289 [Verrucomicrobiales bacterium]|nr:hypothetical protein [Verrucomicrobiales bacterium]